MLREKYSFKRLPNNYILARPYLLIDPSKIKTDLTYIYPISDKQFAITFLTNIKLLITIAPETTTKPDLPPNLQELTQYIKKKIPILSAHIPITNYDIATQTVQEIQEHFKFTLVLNYLIDLPDLSQPE
ncbi:10260_t:CDS:2 [Gigaspora margarita]|uniref:10260_t:CDS:1 n=1 Tax=Gigaspora margarita TaxID=4874 RepID=A0ABN7W9Y9_GIGMA|nr:10260_t:CDS:2 [Gigaspora margarita]